MTRPHAMGPFAPGPWSGARRLLSTALPICMGSLFTSLTVLLSTVLIGRADDSGLLLSGIFLPFSLLISAFIESLRAPTVVLVTQSHHGKEIRSGIGTLALLGGVSMLALAATTAWAGSWIASVLHVPPAVAPRALHFTQCMLAASASLVAGAVLNAALVGLGRPRTAMLVSIASNASNLAVTATCIQVFQQGAESAAWGTAAAGGLMLLMSCWWIPPGHNDWTARRRIGVRAAHLALSIAVPVLASYGLLAVYLALMNQILMSLGIEAVAGFGIANRLQSALMLPAAALGTAMAIHAGTAHRLDAGDSEGRVSRLVLHGLALSVGLYALLAGIIFLSQGLLTDALTGRGPHDPVSSVVSSFLTTVGPSYVFFGPLLALLIYLEQIGRSRVALLFNFLTLGGTLLAAHCVAVSTQDVRQVFLTISASNLLAAFALFLVVRSPSLHRPHLQLA